MDAGAGPDGVAHATLSPDGGASTCAARPADPFVAAFCRLNRPNPYRRFTDTAIWKIVEGHFHPRVMLHRQTDGILPPRIMKVRPAHWQSLQRQDRRRDQSAVAPVDIDGVAKAFIKEAKCPGDVGLVHQTPTREEVGVGMEDVQAPTDRGGLAGFLMVLIVHRQLLSRLRCGN